MRKPERTKKRSTPVQPRPSAPMAAWSSGVVPGHAFRK
jgi:hypothetical protein